MSSHQTNPKTPVVPYPATIGERIRFARDAHGWSQLALATALGINQPTLSRYELDTTLPEHMPYTFVIACARELSVNPEWLMKGMAMSAEDIPYPLPFIVDMLQCGRRPQKLDYTKSFIYSIMDSVIVPSNRAVDAIMSALAETSHQ
jgi:transcriptional regulator with XRE-family HTH domain